ncbi:MAG TPA: hypothetical protein PKA16_12765 [Ottowia sp.]|uniref:F0F1 ATP synthase subunit B family protein n=1 Tax=Ottowia sp. TaxID=1898956 RepID=UPI002C40AA5F|nr:hypothetical protein [Ottowia sp.]HMN22249.1 hypothetical protein [Ottowia sp.]
MSVDWITVVAQLANFLLLVWLLRRFLYRPILAGIDAREAEIARRMAAADEARERAQAAEQRFRRQVEHSVAEQDQVVAEALQATEQQRAQLMAEARSELERQRRAWQAHLAHERDEFMQRLRGAGALTLLELTRKALHDLADEELEAAIARQLGRRLAAMDAELRAAVGASRQARLSTHAPLAATQQQALQAALAPLLPGVALDFVVDAGQAPGVVLQAGGARVAWTVDSYMDEFDAALMQDQAASLAAQLQRHDA